MSKQSRLDRDKMASFGALLQSDHAGIEVFKEFLVLKDLDYWEQIKGVALARDASNKDMWINIGKGRALGDDLKVFFDKCIKLYEERSKDKK